ncbi:hypothetical protein GE321_00545 [Shigella sonnei]|nr:hypothetical protein [Shigella sonnei]
MIKIPLSELNLQEGEALSVGLDLIRNLIRDNVVPDGIYPVIAGGAIRDTFFQNRTPNDVDIFLVQGGLRWNTRQENSPANVGNAALFLDNFLSWTESKGLQVTSRLVQPVNGTTYAEALFTFQEILEIEIDQVKIQMMINLPLDMDTLSRRFPMICQGFMTLGNLYVSNEGLFAMSYTRDIPVVSSREMKYVHKKWPEATVAVYSSSTEYMHLAMGAFGEPEVHLISDLVGPMAGVNLYQNQRRHYTLKMMETILNIPQERGRSYLDEEVNLQTEWSSGLTTIGAEAITQPWTPGTNRRDSWQQARFAAPSTVAPRETFTGDLRVSSRSSGTDTHNHTWHVSGGTARPVSSPSMDDLQRSRRSWETVRSVVGGIRASDIERVDVGDLPTPTEDRVSAIAAREAAHIGFASLANDANEAPRPVGRRNDLAHSDTALGAELRATARELSGELRNNLAGVSLSRETARNMINNLASSVQGNRNS